MENHPTEANRKSGKKKKMKLDWIHITQRSRGNRENSILRDTEEVGQRERGKGQ
jgi:hypothetical protein